MGRRGAPGRCCWNILWFFLFFIEVWLMISIFIDIFRRHDMKGWLKAIWVASRVFHLSDRPERGAVSPWAMVPRAPLILPMWASSRAAVSVSFSDAAFVPGGAR